MGGNSSLAVGAFDDMGMRARVASLVTKGIAGAQAAGELPPFEAGDLAVERTSDPARGDWTSTVALRCAKSARRPPRDVAAAIAARLPQDPAVESVEVAGPGFLNFRLAPGAVSGVFGQVRREGPAYGRSLEGAGRSVDVEFVSANPVGPMHVGHGRWAALGDSLCNVLSFTGWKVTREFYINDAGNQMNVFASSIDMRYRQLCALVREGMGADEACEALERDRLAALDDENGERPQEHPLTDAFNASLGKDAYGGAYIVDIARAFLDQDGTGDLALSDKERILLFRERGYAMMLGNIKEVLSRCGCSFDVWFSERDLYAKGEDGKDQVDQAFEVLDGQGRLYHKDGALWLRTSDLGDDKDRVLLKSDGSYTYFASDIAYHANKLSRGFDRLVDIWGADHHGYVPRMQAAVTALGRPGSLDVLLGQLVNLLRNGVPVRMSKRRGTMVTFEELLDEVGSDAARFILVSRSSDQEIDFDIDLATRQSADNPVYYVQYAHARICSILRKAAGVEGEAAPEELDALAEQAIGYEADLSLLTDPSELALARNVAEFGEVVAGCAKDMAPFRLTHYAADLAAAFHAFYTNCHVLTDDLALRSARLVACDATRRVLAQTLALIGVSAPVSMEQRAKSAEQ